jgi:hypothetical protein
VKSLLEQVLAYGEACADVEAGNMSQDTCNKIKDNLLQFILDTYEPKTIDTLPHSNYPSPRYLALDTRTEAWEAVSSGQLPHVLYVEHAQQNEPRTHYTHWLPMPPVPKQ